MKFFLKNKSKIIKSLLCITVVFSLILCFAFSTSAIAIDGANFNGISVYGVTLILKTSNGSYVPVEIKNCYSLENPKGWPDGLYVEAYNPDDTTLLQADEDYILSCYIEAETYLQGGDKYVVGGYSVCLPAQYVNITDYGSQRFGSTGTTETGKSQKPTTIKDASFFELSGLNYYYDKGILGLNYNSYTTTLKFSSSIDTSSLIFYIVDINFDVLSPQEYASQQVINNQNDNTDKILNSGDYAKPTPDDKNVVAESDSFEEVQRKAHKTAFNWFKDTFTFSHDYFDSGVGNGMKVVNNIWRGILSLPYMEKLLLWSVLLGAISVLVNCIPAITKAINRGKGGD